MNFDEQMRHIYNMQAEMIEATLGLPMTWIGTRPADTIPNCAADECGQEFLDPFVPVINFDEVDAEAWSKAMNQKAYAILRYKAKEPLYVNTLPYWSRPA